MPGFDGEAEQLPLFDGGPDVARLKKEGARLRAVTLSPNTLRAYAEDWRDFEGWCSTVGRKALGARPETLELYAVDRLRTHSLATLERRMAGIVAKHVAEGLASPYDAGVRAVLMGARRERGSRQDRKAALAASDLRTICRALVAKRTERAIRDRALLTLGFAGAFRVSELVALDLADIDFVRQGLAATIRRSKTDQKGLGRVVGVFFAMRAYCCPVRSLKAWLKIRGKKPGPLFPGEGATGRFTIRAVGDVVKRSVKLAGLDPRAYGSHSLRAGFVTCAAERGVSESVIMQRTGHRSVATVARYVRPATIFSLDALARAL
jgi:integrase